MAYEWIKQPDELKGLVIASVFLVFAALVFMTVRVPTVAADKASYALMMLAPLSALAGAGLGTLAGRNHWRRIVVLAGIGCWAAAAVAGYWIDRSSPEASLSKALDRLGMGDNATAIAMLRSVHQDHPQNQHIRVALARVLIDNGGAASEIDALLRLGDSGPEPADKFVALAIWAARRGDIPAALSSVRRAVELDADALNAVALLATVLEYSGDATAAIEAWREVLRIDPQDRSAHAALARLYQHVGASAGAAMHRAYVARLARQ